MSDPYNGQMSQLYWGAGTGAPGDAAYQGLDKWAGRTGEQAVGEAFTDPNPKIQALIDSGLITRTAQGDSTSNGMQQYHYDLSPSIYGPGGAPAPIAPLPGGGTNPAGSGYNWGLIENPKDPGVGPTYNDPNYGNMGLYKQSGDIGLTGKIGEAITMAALAAGFGYVGAGALGSAMGGGALANTAGNIAGKTMLGSLISGKAPGIGSGIGAIMPIAKAIYANGGTVGP